MLGLGLDHLLLPSEDSMTILVWDVVWDVVWILRQHQLLRRLPELRDRVGDTDRVRVRVT